MLNFDRDRFVRIQSGAVAIADEARSLMRTLLAEGVERLFFMGTGGVQLLTLPAIELAKRYSTFPVSAEYPAQVVLDPPAGLDNKAVVVIPSLSGTTKEGVELMAFLKKRGVRTISLTGHSDTPIAQEADHNFTNFAEDDTSSESFYLQTLLIVIALLAERGEYDGFDTAVAELKLLPGISFGMGERYGVDVLVNAHDRRAQFRFAGVAIAVKLYERSPHQPAQPRCDAGIEQCRPYHVTWYRQGIAAEVEDEAGRKLPEHADEGCKQD